MMPGSQERAAIVASHS
ncbi:unnamed protein product, partial [Didymodactylos carnosus]